MKVKKFPKGFIADSNGIWSAVGHRPQKSEIYDDSNCRFLTRMDKFRLFNTYEFAQVMRHWIALNWMKEHSKDRSRMVVLDIGCSQSQMYHMWHNQGNFMKWPVLRYIGIDGNYKTMAFGRKIYDKKGSDRWDHIWWNAIDQIVFDEKVDIIICMETLEHMSESEAQWLFRNMRRNIKDDGILIISSPNPVGDEISVYDSKEHRKEYKFKEAKKLIRRNGFEIGLGFGLAPRREGHRFIRKITAYKTHKLHCLLPASVISNLFMPVVSIRFAKQWMMLCGRKK